LLILFEDLMADKLTTIGPNTIGVSYERADEQFKQVYDVITLFLSNKDELIRNVKIIERKYQKVALEECKIHEINYDKDILYNDMLKFIKEIQNIESNSFFKIANDFQSLYLRKSVTRDKSEWAIIGYQLELIVEFIFKRNKKITKIREIEDLVDHLKFTNVTGPSRGNAIKNARERIMQKFDKLNDISNELFRKSPKRIIWELLTKVSFDELKLVIYQTATVN
jgi:hypothetical protein